jgi:hypothetical protein
MWHRGPSASPQERVEKTAGQLIRTQYTVNFVLTGASELKIPEIQHVISTVVEDIVSSGAQEAIRDCQSREIFRSEAPFSGRLLDSGHSGLRKSRMVTISD